MKDKIKEDANGWPIHDGFRDGYGAAMREAEAHQDDNHVFSNPFQPGTDDPREDALPPGLRMAKAERQPSHLPEDANPIRK